MTEKEQRTAAKNFADFWKDKGYEKGESQQFWLSLLRNVLGVEKPEEFIEFEEKVKIDNTSFIDGHIHATHVIIEQKSIDKDLRKGVKQSDGSFLTPFQQAKRYSIELPYTERPRWIVTCNFKEFLIYDMQKPTGDPESLLLKDLPKEYYRLKFLVDTGNDQIKKEMEVSVKAGEIVGLLYDEILNQYKNPESPETLKSLNALCVRLVFCLYAEDSGLFGEHLKFHDYLKSYAVKDVRRALVDLFKVLDTKIEERDPYLDDMLASFPYVNGGLFADENIEIYREQIDKTVKRLMLFDKRARKADRKFYERLSGLQRKIDEFCEPTKSGNHYFIDPQNITLVQELEEDYKRRQGNIVLRAIKNIKPEIFERKYRHKVNDNRLKRNLAISHRKVGKLIGGFLASFGEESEYLSWDYTNRLQEIEEEMEAERERQEAQEARASRYNYCKE